MPVNFYNYKYNLLKKYSIGKVCDKHLEVNIYKNCIFQPLARNDENIFTGGLYTQDGEYITTSGMITNNKVYMGADIRAPQPTEILHGKSLYIGFCHAHYGHFIIETLSRLWCHEKHQLRNFDNIIILTSGPLRTFSIDIFKHLNINNKISIIKKPMSIEEIYVPDVPIIYPSVLYNKIDLISKLFPLNQDIAKSKQPLFISRTLLIPGQHRLIIGEEYIEKILEENGVKIFHPQNHSILEQISIIRSHHTLISFAGSALHTMILSGGRNKVFAYTSRSVPKILPLIDKALQNDATYINCRETNMKGLYDKSVGFKPELINPKPIILKLFKEGIIKKYSFDEFDTDNENRIIIKQYNTAILMRYIHEAHSKNKENKCRKEIVSYLNTYEIDNKIFEKSLKYNTYMEDYFSP